MQRRQVLGLIGGVAVWSCISARPVAETSLIHDLPRTEEALFELTRGAAILPSNKIDLLTPPQVEYGPRWPVRIVQRIAGARWAALVIEQNPQPLAALVHFHRGLLGDLAFHCKIADSSQVTVVVAAAGKFYGVRRFMPVVGTCR